MPPALPIGAAGLVTLPRQQAGEQRDSLDPLDADSSLVERRAAARARSTSVYHVQILDQLALEPGIPLDRLDAPGEGVVSRSNRPDVDALLEAAVREAATLLGARGGRAGLRTAGGALVQASLGEPLASPRDVTATLAVPLLDGQGAVTGFIEVHGKAGGFTGPDHEKLTGLSRIAAIAVDNAVNYRKVSEAEQALKLSHERLRRLSEHLVSAREEERARVAREVHDELGQALTGLKVDVAWMGQRLRTGGEPPYRALADKLASMDALIDATILATRRLVSELRPPALDQLGLAAAIEWQAQEFQRRTGIRCRVRCEREDLGLDPQQSASIFRIVQEALTNVSRHACATRVTITLEVQARGLWLQIEDNGRGISALELSDQDSFGLLGMRERARLLGGELEVAGTVGAGTTVTLRVPSAAEAAS